MGDNDTRNM